MSKKANRKMQQENEKLSLRVAELERQNASLRNQLERREMYQSAFMNGFSADVDKQIENLQAERDHYKQIAQEYEQAIRTAEMRTKSVEPLELEMAQRAIQYLNETFASRHIPEPLRVVLTAYDNAQEHLFKAVNTMLVPRMEEVEPNIYKPTSTLDRILMLLYKHRFFGVHSLAQNMIQDVAIKSGSIPSICWGIMFGLWFNRSDESLLEIVQQLPTEWIQETLEGNPSHRKLVEGLRVAHDVQLGMTIPKAANKHNSSERYISRFRQWYKVIDNTKMTILPAPDDKETITEWMEDEAG